MSRPALPEAQNRWSRERGQELLFRIEEEFEERLSRFEKIYTETSPVIMTAPSGGLFSLQVDDQGLLYTRKEGVDYRMASSLFSETITVERTPIIELLSIHGTSVLRDVETVTGSAAISLDSGGELLLSTGATASSAATLESAEYGRYMPGYGGNVGVGVRVPTAPTGNQYAEWGLSDGTDGVYFGYDATGLYIAYSRGGAETKVYSTNFSLDKLDGSGPSGYTLDMSDGIIFNVTFSWYSYGAIVWEVCLQTDQGQRVFPCHKVKIDGSTSIQTPNLPIWAKADNGGDAADFDIYLGSRQYSIVGPFNPTFRYTGETRSGVSTSTTPEPTVTFRRKTGNRGKAIVVAGFDLIIGTEDVLVELRVNEGLTGASYGTPGNYSAAETALEVDIAATATDGAGEVVWSGIFPAGTTAQKVDFSKIQDGKLFEVPREQPITLVVTALANTGTATVHLRMREEW